MSRQAYEFAKSYLPSLIRGINQTAQEKVAGIIAAWIEAGEPLSLLKTQLQEVFEDPKRAAAIAQTESNRVFQAGSESRYRSVGVKKAKWNTVRDNDVCPQCTALDGKVANLDEGWSKGVKPPAHPRCRCWMNPVVTDAVWGEFTAEQ